jgi:fructose-bisphosphate aldolase, class I
MKYEEIRSILGDEADSLLNHSCQKISKDEIYRPNHNQVKDIFSHSNRSPAVVENLERLYSHGRLGGSGYLSVFPVDQAIEHTAAYSFYRNPLYFDPETIVRFALEGQCSGVASTVGALGLVAKKYSQRIPFIVKLNHNELLTYPNKHDMVMFSSVEQAYDLGAAGVGATIYFGSPESNRQLVEIARAFEQAHRLGMFTMLWCYPRNPGYNKDGEDYTEGADITGQAIHLGVTLQADIVKQKLPTAHKGFQALQFAKYKDEMYDRLLTDHPVDLVRYQVANAYMGKISLINSGGEANGGDDLKEAVRTAVINKRGGGAGLIMGRKLFKRSFEEGLKILWAVQDVYLDDRVTVA